MREGKRLAVLTARAKVCTLMWNSCFLAVSVFCVIRPEVADPPHIKISFTSNCFSLLTLVSEHELSSRWRGSSRTWPDQSEETTSAHSCATAHTTSTWVGWRNCSCFLPGAESCVPLYSGSWPLPRSGQLQDWPVCLTGTTAFPTVLWAKLEMTEMTLVVVRCTSLEESWDVWDYLRLT